MAIILSHSHFLHLAFVSILVFTRSEKVWEPLICYIQRYVFFELFM